MPSEKEIQAFIEKTIQNGELHRRIPGRDDLEKAALAHQSADFVANFNLDYLLRVKSIASSSAVLEMLQDVDIVSTSRNNISSERGERLFPDLVLVSRTTGHIIILEIKRDNQTSREALTELLAYEQEIRNQLPYLSNSQIAFVLVSSEYPVLLSHAIGQAVLWQDKNILSLHVTEANDDFAVAITHPVGWSSTRLNFVPANCFEIAELTVEARSDQESEILDALVLDMTYEISRQGDQSGGHGFVLVSNDHSARSKGRHNDVYTIGVIDPSKMQHEVLKKSVGSDSQSPLAAYVAGANAKPLPTFDLFSQLLSTAEPILSRHGRTELRRAGSLIDWRNNTMSEVYPMSSYDPYAMLFWGLPLTFRQHLVNHNGMNEIFPFLKRVPSSQNARIGLFVLANMTNELFFPSGNFNHKGLWSFGSTIGCAISILQSVSEKDAPKIENADAALSWLGNEFIAGMTEVAYRVQGVESMPSPPPIQWGASKHADEMLKALLELVDWFQTEFLVDNESHLESFLNGLKLHHVCDRRLCFAVDEKALASLTKNAISIATAALQFAKDAVSDSSVDAHCKVRISTIVETVGLSFGCDENSVGDESWVQSLPAILAVYDEVLPSVLHELQPVNLSGVDWDWMKQEVLRFAAKGAGYIGIVVRPGGQIEIANIEAQAEPFPAITDYESEIFVAIDETGNILRIKRSSWSDVFNGIAFS